MSKCINVNFDEDTSRRYEVLFYDAADTRYVNRATEAGSVIALSERQPPLLRPPRRRKTGSRS
jgi:hypothetical protein